MATPSGTPTDLPSGLPWREPGRLWRAAFWVFVLCGGFCGSMAWGWSSLLAAALGLGTIGVLVGTVIWGPLGWRGIPRIINSGVLTGLGISAAAGLLAQSPGLGALALLALAGTHPITAFGLKFMLGHEAASSTSDDATVDEAKPPPKPRTADLPSMPLETVDDATLCEVWCQSYLSLCTAENRDDAAVIAAYRQGYLDEMVRRNPVGMAAWFASGARPGASPMTFLTRH
jgi:hypothetical protein